MLISAHCFSFKICHMILSMLSCCSAVPTGLMLQKWSTRSWKELGTWGNIVLSILSLQKHLWEHGFISFIYSPHSFSPSAGCMVHAAGAHNSSGMALLLGWAAGSKFSLGSVRDWWTCTFGSWYWFCHPKQACYPYIILWCSSSLEEHRCSVYTD